MGLTLATQRDVLRYLISDLSGDAISDVVLRDTYLNPTYNEWWRRHERRPGAGLNGDVATFSVGDRTAVATGISIDQSTLIEHGYITVSGVQTILRRSEFNRIRYNQETQGLTGTPTEFGVSYTWNDASQPKLITCLVAVYPIPDVAATLQLAGAGKAAALVADGDSMLVSPVAARWITRLAAYRAGAVLELPARQMTAIKAGLPDWVRAAYLLDQDLQRSGSTPGGPDA